MKIAVIGAGWAGLAAAIEASRCNHSVHVFEASRSLGGRARSIQGSLPDGTHITLDNGQHILIGAYSETLNLMRFLGVPVEQHLRHLPMCLRFPDGTGLQFPDLPTPLDALMAIMCAKGWDWRDKINLVQAALQWQKDRFRCDEQLSVAALCNKLRPRAFNDLIEPLCVSALNTPPHRASAQVFLRVLQDALFGVRNGSKLLLPCSGLSDLFPEWAACWLQERGHSVTLGARITQLQTQSSHWQIDGQSFDQIVLATPVWESTRLLSQLLQNTENRISSQISPWISQANEIHFEAITTVYAWNAGLRLNRPMMALRSSEIAPAQFVFDRGQLGGPSGLLAFVVSASRGEVDKLQTQVLLQARQQLNLELLPVKTVIEKRATFACTPGLKRPSMQLAPGLLVCGDYVDGPYPATIEGAVRSGQQAARLLA